ncbi:hypothetical protein GY21_19845 [Cryobacterium roopkundense]|uniref:DUF4386 family protein n=1 Tax=Cryobacterium roopkundense TaxID=1001240 RepID=A0A099J2K1_9MICO|nr:DUF4386 family protein [Cryobacterium roopkundense]KGJ71782.1 hypothetical protein GY21_19845 [Cryobacterium roopkundense]MBB5643447.1 hypothetical protein [Cryobacterium roopkundense]
MMTTASDADAHRAHTTVQSWRTLFYVGGIAAILFVMLFLCALVLDFLAPPPENGGVETLEFISRNRAIYSAEQILWILPDILPVLTFLALFVALAPDNKALALICVTVAGVGWALLRVLPTSGRGSLVLVNLSDSYVEAGSASQRQVYSTAAEVIIAENNTPSLLGVLSAVGIALASTAMIRSALPRLVGWLGVVAGVVGVVSEVSAYTLPALSSAYGLLLWAWFVSVGIALIRLARRTPERGPGAADGTAGG